MTDTLRYSPMQERVLGLPECYDVALLGGRGGAKSYTMALLTLQHVERYRDAARVLYLRQTHKGCDDFAGLCLDVFGVVYGRALRWNSQDGVFRFPNGAQLEINQLETPGDYAKFQGRSFSMLLLDEAGQHASPHLLDRMRSNLRGPRDMPLRVVLAANPGEIGHQWIHKRHVVGRAPWDAVYNDDTKTRWVLAPSTYRDNPFIDRAAYRRQLEASCAGDPELLRAWVEGDWNIARGAYFALCLDERRNMVADWPALPMYHGKPWEHWLAHDFGSSAPSVTYLCAKSPGQEVDGQWFARDSIVLVDEVATNRPDDLNVGMGYTVPVLAEHIKDMCEQWGVRAKGCADDAIFARMGSGAGSIAEEFARCEVNFYPARKADRISGWQRMRLMLAYAGEPDKPGLYVARRCTYFWQTVPFLARDPRRPDDLASAGTPEHGADACRYGLLHERRVVQQFDMYGDGARFRARST